MRHLYVARALCGRAIGSTLLDALLTEARLTFKRVRLRTNTQAASRFYERRGFERVAEPNATHALDLP